MQRLLPAPQPTRCSGIKAAARAAKKAPRPMSQAGALCCPGVLRLRSALPWCAHGCRFDLNPERFYLASALTLWLRGESLALPRPDFASAPRHKTKSLAIYEGCRLCNRMRRCPRAQGLAALPCVFTGAALRLPTRQGGAAVRPIAFPPPIDVYWCCHKMRCCFVI